MIEPSIDLKKNIFNICDKSLKYVKNTASTSMQINIYIFILFKVIFKYTIFYLDKFSNFKKNQTNPNHIQVSQSKNSTECIQDFSLQ